MARDVCPSADLNESLGAANQRWKKVYVGEVVEEESNFISRLVTKLASKAAISVSSLSKESIFYRLLSYALDASGVEYNFNNANAWYICFGDLLGGLIIQGGNDTTDSTAGKTVYYPIAFNNSCKTIVSPVVAPQQIVTIMAYNESYFGTVAFNTTNGDYVITGLNFNWLAIGQ